MRDRCNWAVVTAGLFLWGPAWPAQLSTTPIKSCARIAEDRDRLACFDREIAALSAEDARKESAANKAPPAPALTQEQKLGLPQSKVEKLETPKDAPPSPPKITGLSAHLARVTVNAAGREVFTLDNGQVWMQAETNPGFTAHQGDVVQITSGVLGSFFLSAGKHASTRVSRVS